METNDGEIFMHGEGSTGTSFLPCNGNFFFANNSQAPASMPGLALGLGADMISSSAAKTEKKSNIYLSGAVMPQQIAAGSYI